MVEKDFFKRQLAIELRALRIYRGYTLEYLAELADISHIFLSRIELGKAEPKTYTLYKLCHALEVSPSTLFLEVAKKYEESLLE